MADTKGDWFVYDERFGRTYFATEAERDAKFLNATYIDQKWWWVGHVNESRLKPWPDAFVPEHRRPA